MSYLAVVSALRAVVGESLVGGLALLGMQQVATYDQARAPLAGLAIDADNVLRICREPVLL
jgi:hypothetical protein